MCPLTTFIFFLAIGSLGCQAKFTNSEECLIEHQMSWKDFRDRPPTDKKMKCFYSCIYDKGGVILNGTYVGDHKPCEGVKDNDICELGYKLKICRQKKA